jgi:hypothetical protein
MDSEKRPEGRPTHLSRRHVITTFVAPAALVTLTGGPSVSLLIEAEAHVRQALRIVELDPDPDARREAKILDLAAARIRARRAA